MPMITINSTALRLMRLFLVLLAVVLSFAQAQRQVCAQKSPPFLRFSTSALALLFMSIANSGQILVQAQPPDFQLVGNGACRDCSGTGSNGEYDKIDFRHGTSGATITSADDCVRLCVACAVEVSSGNPNREFRGFVFVDGVSTGYECACYFDDDTVDFTNECQNIVTTCSGVAESPFRYTSNRAGTGEMCTSSSNTASECFKLTAPFVASDHAPTGCPSMIPSTSPSSSEVPSDVPSDFPSTSPSLNPSSKPSETPSSMPSESPSSNPSSMPSESPSSDPSSEPSSEPSSGPSSEPSDTPSCLPSAYPTESPSTEFGKLV